MRHETAPGSKGPALLTIRQASDLLGVSERTVRRLIAHDRLRRVEMVSGEDRRRPVVRIRREDLDAYIEARTVGGAA